MLRVRPFSDRNPAADARDDHDVRADCDAPGCGDVRNVPCRDARCGLRGGVRDSRPCGRDGSRGDPYRRTFGRGCRSSRGARLCAYCGSPCGRDSCGDPGDRNAARAGRDDHCGDPLYGARGDRTGCDPGDLRNRGDLYVRRIRRGRRSDRAGCARRGDLLRDLLRNRRDLHVVVFLSSLRRWSLRLQISPRPRPSAGTRPV